MPAQLVALSEGANILLDKPILLIGRHPEADIQINSRKVSRLHCCIAQVSDFLVVRDLGSTNGIRINGTRVIEGRLREGDELTIGNQRFQVQWGDVPVAPPPPANRPPPPRGKTKLDDDDLESFDEPVPLPESAAPPGPIPAAGRRAPPPAGEHPTAGSSGQEPPEPPHTRILPDELELAPASSDSISPPRPTPPV